MEKTNKIKEVGYKVVFEFESGRKAEFDLILDGDKKWIDPEGHYLDGDKELIVATYDIG